MRALWASFIGCVGLASCKFTGGPLLGVNRSGFVYGWNARIRHVATTEFDRRVEDSATSVGGGQVFQAGEAGRSLGFATLGYERFSGDERSHEAVRYGGFVDVGVQFGSNTRPMALTGIGAGNGGDFFCGQDGTVLELLVGVRLADKIELIAAPSIGHAMTFSRCGGN